MNIDQAIHIIKAIKHEARSHDDTSTQDALNLAACALKDMKYNFENGYPLFISPELMKSLEAYYSEQLRHALEKQRKH